MGRIVVGIDGSEESRPALRWAIDEARLRGWQVHAVHAWEYPYLGGSLGYMSLPNADLAEQVQQHAREILDEAADAVIGDDDDIYVERVIEEGPAPRVLLEAARYADLLVVGSRGRGGFSGLLLGSVSQVCSQHAPCPVLIVPHERKHKEAP